MSDRWSTHAQAYRESEAHRSGADLDLIVEWAEGQTALDVATGGGHVARRLREAGLDVVTVDPAPGMEPDVLSRAEHLPFADGSFDVVVTPDRSASLRRRAGGGRRDGARVGQPRARRRQPLSRTTAVEEAERLRDPTHVRNYGEEEWRELFARAGLDVEAVELVETDIDLEAWLARAGCEGDEAERVTELLADRVRRRPPGDDADRAQGTQARPLMAIIVDRDTRLVVQGLTGSEGRFHGLRNRNYGTNVVAGVTPGKGGAGRRGHPGVQHRRGGRLRGRTRTRR